MSFDPSISNGTCYWAANQQANSRFIPCGNAALGNVPCCESGDVCLSSRACFNGQYYVTYLAGCTDQDYADGNCPDKGDYSDQSWTGLVYCNSSSRQWTGCKNPQPSSGQDIATVVSVKQGSCWCPTTSRSVLFTDAATLANYLSLPASIGQQITLGGGLTTNPYQSVTPSTDAPSSTSSSLSSSGNSSGSSTSVTTASTSTDIAPSSASSTSSSSAESTSTGMIVGAAVGGAMGLIALIAVFTFFMQRYYRKKREAKAAVTGAGTEEKSKRPNSTFYTDDVLYQNQGHGGLSSPCFKPELAADEVKSPGKSSRFSELTSLTSEVEGSSSIGHNVGRPISNGGYEMPGKPGTLFEMA